ncbi:MAG: hypothetical protein RL514_3502 [Verrucomicrobiota bacterium]|jgi:ATP sulfurylase
MALFDLFSSRKTTAQTNTTTAVDSYNRAFNSVRNTADSNNMNIIVGAAADPFTKSGDSVQKTALQAAGVVLVAAAIAWAYSGRGK